MNLKDAIREAYVDAICTQYGTEVTANIMAKVNFETERFDEMIGLEDLMARIDSEINLATDELQYSGVFDDKENE